MPLHKHQPKKKTFAKQFLGKHKFHIRKNKEKNLIGQKIRYGIYGIILVFLGIIFFNLQPDSNQNIQHFSAEEEQPTEFSYLFYDQAGNEYNIFSHNGEHGAPQSWEYLFEWVEVPTDTVTTGSNEEPTVIEEPSTETDIPADNWTDSWTDTQQGVVTPWIVAPWAEVATWIVAPWVDAPTGGKISIQHTPLPLPEIPVNPNLVLEKPIQQEIIIAETWTQQGVVTSWEEATEGGLSTQDTTKEGLQPTNPVWTGKTFTFIGRYLLVPRNPLPPKEQPPKWIQIIPDYQKCDTPRGYQITHGASVLAYEQDPNTPDTCKIERRFCQNGKLSGSFRQQSCSVNTDYSYFQEQFVAYNTNKKSDFIQPTPTPWYTAEALEQGNTKSWIDEILDIPNPAGTNRGQEGNSISNESPEVEQTERPHPDCKTPRGETVKHGQFVKAYKYKNGFNDAPCEVQLRTCVVGTLEGTYEQLSCRHRDTSYIDRLNNYPTRESGYSQEKMRWIKQIRDSETYYSKEYGNTLRSETLDKILKILDM